MIKRLTKSMRDNRKYGAWWIVFIVSSIGLYAKILTGDQWVTVVSGAYAIYMVGNVGEHFSNSKEGSENVDEYDEESDLS